MTIKDPVWLVERNVHGAWVVYGIDGVKQYYGYTRREAVERYKAEVDRTMFFNEKSGNGR